MLSFSQTVGFAILVMGYVESAKGRWVGFDEIGTRTGVPRPNVRKVLHTLSKSGLIRSKRGSRGGFHLTRPAAQISLADIAEAIETTKRKSDCLLGLPGCCEANPCPTHRFWKKNQAEIEDYLRRVTIAEVAGLLTCCAPGDDASEGRLGEQTPQRPGRNDLSAPQQRASDAPHRPQRIINGTTKVA